MNHTDPDVPPPQHPPIEAVIIGGILLALIPILIFLIYTYHS